MNRTKIWLAVSVIGSAATGFFVSCKKWDLAAILALCTIGAFIFQAALMVGDRISDEFKRYVNWKRMEKEDQEFQKLLEELDSQED